MKRDNILPRVLLGLALLLIFTVDRVPGWAEPLVRARPIAEKGSMNQETNPKILVEIFLSRDHKDDVDKIRKEFESVFITKVRPQIFRLGYPPENIAIGRNVSADVARLTIRLALTYNRGIKLLLPQERLSADYIAFGTSIFDESFQRPITPDQLKQLSDPSLTTEQFHVLYRHITGEDQRKP
jgi:hypothetical protein